VSNTEREKLVKAVRRFQEGTDDIDNELDRNTFLQLIDTYVEDQKREARISEAKYIYKMFESHLFDPTGTMGFDEHVSRRSQDEIERAQQYNHNHAWAAASAAGKVKERIADLHSQQQGEPTNEPTI